MGPSRRTHTDRPLAAALVVAVLYLGFLAAALARRDFDASFFVQAGDVFVNAAHAPAGLFILKNSAGYDGQFYYRLALTPFTDKRTDRGVRLDSPRYRQQRILYPLMARLLSVGATHLVPWALVAVNYVGVCAIGWLGGLFARSLGRHALWGTAFALYPGFLMTMSRDLPEIVEVGLVLAAVVGLRRGRPLLATTLLVLAVGAKETALLVAVGALLAWAVGMARERHQPPLWFGLLPAVGYGAWQTWLYFHWPEPLRLGVGVGTNIGAPFVAFVRFLRRTSAMADHLNAVWFAELVLLIAFVVLVGIAYGRSTVGFHLKLCWLLYVGLAVTLSRAVWVEDYAFLRALSEVYVLGVAILLGSKSRWTPAVAAGGLLCWALLAVDLVANR